MSLPETRPSDHLGPLARSWEEVRARAQKAFGITPEESARRAELRRTWKDPNDESRSMLNAQPSSSATPSSPLNLINLLQEITNAPNSVNPVNAVETPNHPSTIANHQSSIIHDQFPHQSPPSVSSVPSSSVLSVSLPERP